MATKKTAKSRSSKTKSVDGTKAVRLGGPSRSGVHPGSRDSGYQGTVHWDGEPAGDAFLIRPPGGAKLKLEFCNVLPVSGEFDIQTTGGAHVTRDP